MANLDFDGGSSENLSSRVIRVLDGISGEFYYLMNLKVTLIQAELDGKVNPYFLRDLERLTELAQASRKDMRYAPSGEEAD